MSNNIYKCTAFLGISCMWILLASQKIEAFIPSFQLKSTSKVASCLSMAVTKRSKRPSSVSTGDVEDVITSYEWLDQNYSAVENPRDNDKLNFPEASQSSIDEKALRKTPFGKILFGVIDVLFPVFKEPNWFDVYG